MRIHNSHVIEVFFFIPLLISAEVWHIKEVEFHQEAELLGVGNSIRIDASDNPHISYLDMGCDSLKYSSWHGSGWTIERIDHTRGGSTSLALDLSGYPCISYYAYAEGDLKYAWFDGLGWHIDTVDSDGNVGNPSSLALDANGTPHFSYYDASNTALIYAYWDSEEWIREIVDDTGSVGRFSSLALDKEQKPHISYYDATNDALAYAYKGDSGWETSAVDTEDECFSGVGTSIALDSSGNPHIAYLSRTWLGNYGSQKYANWDEQGWHTRYIDGGFDGDVSTPSLAIDGSDIPCMSYDGHAFDDEFDRKLYFAKDTDSGWVVEDIPGSWGSWLGTSLDLDSVGRPHIAYQRAYYCGLCYAYLAPDDVRLQIEEAGSYISLSWERYPGTAFYSIYGARNDPYFSFEQGPHGEHLLATLPSIHHSWETANGIGHPDENWIFLILARDETDIELARSNRVGEYDFELDHLE